MNNFDYNLIVIGGGSGGISSVILAKNLGKKVALIEKRRIGGECTWSGCIPSKALIKAAETAFEVNHMNRVGLQANSEFKLNTGHVMDHVRSIIQRVYQEEKPDVFKKMGIDVFIGAPQFLNNHSIQISDQKISSNAFVISTGSSPSVPSIPGLELIQYLTNENMFEMKKLPKSMIVLGGGPIGMEMAQAFHRLGTKITVVQRSKILKKDDRELVKILCESLQTEGIEIYTDTTPVQFLKTDNLVVMIIEKNGEKRELKAEKILIAAGRKPNVNDMQLENAGIRYTSAGIEVNNRLQTSSKNIYAIGDVINRYLFSHVAEYQASIAVQNAVLPLPLKRKVDYRSVPWATFTDPELAHSGLTEDQGREKWGDKIKIYRYPFNHVDRAKTDLAELGLGKFIFDPKNRIVGIHILGQRASELLHEAQLIKVLGLSFSKIQSMIHIYPTYGDVLKRSSGRFYADRIRDLFPVRLLEKLTSFRRKKR